MPIMGLNSDFSESGLIKLQRTLRYLLENLDHENVRRLYTEHCEIKSADGETIIDGPLLKMYDKQNPAVMRLRIGYDSDIGKFIFEMKNNLDQLTLYQDDDGNANYTGIITGSLFRSAESGKRFELGNSGYSSYIDFFDSNDNNTGWIYSDTANKLHIFNKGQLDLHAGGTIDIQAVTNAQTGLSGDVNIQASGTGSKVNIGTGVIYATSDDKLGFFSATPVSKDEALNQESTIPDLPSSDPADLTYGSTEVAMINNLYDRVDKILDALKAYGLV